MIQRVVVFTTPNNTSETVEHVTNASVCEGVLILKRSLWPDPEDEDQRTSVTYNLARVNRFDAYAEDEQ